MTSRMFLVLASSAVLYFGGTAEGAPLAYEGFDATIYNNGASGTGADFSVDDLRGQGAGSGSGFTGNWGVPTLDGDPASGSDYWTNSDTSAATNYFRASTAQGGYTDGNGNSLVTTPGQGVFSSTTATPPRVSLQRNFTTGNNPGDPLYASALLTYDGTNHAYVGFASNDNVASNVDRPFEFGIVGDGRVFIAADATGNERQTLLGSILAPGTYLFVARFTDDGTGNDTVDLWVDPVLGAVGEAAAPDLTFNEANPANDEKNFLVANNATWSIDGIIIDAGGLNDDGIGDVMVDELRFGTTFADVTPFTSAVAIPEPATLGLVLLGVASLALPRRRRL